MSNKSVKKYKPLPPELKKQVDESGEELSIGDMFFDANNSDRIIRIGEFVQDEKWANSNQKDKTKIKYWSVRTEIANDLEATEWSSWGSKDVDTFLKYIKSGKYVKITKPLSELMNEANRVISGEISMEVYQQNEYDQSINDETALIGRSSKSTLVAIQKGLEEKKHTADLVHKAICYEMEKRRRELSAIKDKLYGVVAVFQKQVSKIMRVITTIELYLGIEEELHQIQVGEKAPAETPISFRQMVLYIDEEVGVHEDGGLDFRSIKQFDEWLIADKNINIVLPEKKGVVVFNPRRHKKEYNNDYLNIVWNTENKFNTYILIRNGDCIDRGESGWLAPDFKYEWSQNLTVKSQNMILTQQHTISFF